VTQNTPLALVVSPILEKQQQKSMFFRLLFALRGGERERQRHLAPLKPSGSMARVRLREGVPKKNIKWLRKGPGFQKQRFCNRSASCLWGCVGVGGGVSP
jgi:hypothetical protein